MVMHRHLKGWKCLEKRQHEKRKLEERNGEIIQIKRKQRKALRTRGHKKRKKNREERKKGKEERIKQIEVTIHKQNEKVTDRQKAKS